VNRSALSLHPDRVERVGAKVRRITMTKAQWHSKEHFLASRASPELAFGNRTLAGDCGLGEMGDTQNKTRSMGRA
jgi:hypothetical protein